MTDRASARDWVERYKKAWLSNSPTDIADLFTEEAVYRPTPTSRGWSGHDEIIQGWLLHANDPGTWKFEYDVLAVDIDLAVIRGVTAYDPPHGTYDNIWLVRLAPDGRAREYTEFWIERPKPKE